MSLKKLLASAAAAFILLFYSFNLIHGDAFPPVDQKRLPLMLKAHGIFWAGGQIVNRTQSGTQNAGDLKNIPYQQQQYLVGQAYVEYFIPLKLRNGKNTPPLVMVPGGALVGVHFLTTPDGREGWADYFLRRGFPVYIVDVPGRGRAGFMPDAFNDVKAGVAQPSTQPVIRAWDSSAWLEWNTGPLPAPTPMHGPNDTNCIGNDGRDPKNPPVYCNGNLMPALDPEGYKHWLASLVPEGPVQGGSDAGLLAVMTKLGPAIWLGHSLAGTTGARLSNENPQAFKAVIGIEPQGACNMSPETQIKGVAKVPQFSIHGINQVGRPDTGPCLETYAKINAAGGDATYLSLPKLPRSPLFDRIPQAGIWGNDHIMMWNSNSDQIAELVLKWIEKHIEKKKVKTPW
jgi:pimeloyl-ACP methyl ester carboxylesterase